MWMTQRSTATENVGGNRVDALFFAAEVGRGALSRVEGPRCCGSFPVRSEYL